MKVNRGDIWYADLSPVVGSEQGGIRPVVIVQNDAGNKFSPTVIVVAITSKHKKALPTHVKLDSHAGLAMNSTVMTEQLRTLSKMRLRQKVGAVSALNLQEIDRALRVSMQLG